MGMIPGQLGRLSNWPQYDPNSGGVNPSGGPFIPKAPTPAMTPSTNFAAQQMAPFGDTQAAGTMAGVRPKRKGR